MPNMNDPAALSFYYTAPLFLPATIDDTQFLGIYSSVSNLPTGQLPFSTAGIAGTGSMYVYLNNSWQFVGQYLYDAYRYLVYYQGSAFASASGTKWTSIFNDIASNSSLMTEFSANSTATSNLVASSTAMNAIIGNSSALNTVVNSSTAMSAIAGSSTAMSAVAGSSTAMTAIAGSSTAMSAIIGNSSALNTVVSSSTAMSAVAGSSTAMSAVAGSSTAMQAVGNSKTAMSTILPSSTYANTWWGSSYYVGLGLNTYAGLNNSTLAGLNTISAIAGNSTAMNAIIGSYTAMNAMIKLSVKNALQSASGALSSIQTLVSNINSGSIVLGGGTAGSSSALGLNALLVLLSYDNGAAVPAGNATSSPTPTLAQKMYTAYSPTQNGYYNSSYTSGAYTTVLTLATNQIVFVLYASAAPSGYAAGLGNASGYQTNGTGASNIIYTTGSSYPNEGTSPLLLSGTLYVEAATTNTTYYYYLTYTPS